VALVTKPDIFLAGQHSFEFIYPIARFVFSSRSSKPNFLKIKNPICYNLGMEVGYENQSTQV
jgi:hypothetical protein